MTAVTDTHAATHAVVYRITGRRVLRSEWAKLWSLRSSWIAMAFALLLLVGIGVISAAAYTPGIGSGFGAVNLALNGLLFSSLVFGALGVLITAAEYSTGSIRSTFAAVPRRLPVLWAKTALFGAIAAVSAAAGAVTAFLFGEISLRGDRIALSLGDPGVLRCLLGAGLYLGLVGMLAAALGALIRSTAGALASLVGLLIFVPLIISNLPGAWARDITPYLPSNAGQAITHLTPSAHDLGPWTGTAVCAGWVALALATAAVRMVRTDA